MAREEISSFYLLMRQLSILDPSERKEIDMYLMESTSYVERPSASSVLLSIGPMHWAHLMDGGKSKNLVVLLLFAASTHSLLSPASSHTERKSAEPRPDL